MVGMKNSLPFVSDALAQRAEMLEIAETSLVRSWRDKYPGKPDHQVMREVLCEHGFKYSRRDDRWRNRETGASVRMRTLEELAKIIAAQLLAEAEAEADRKYREAVIEGAAALMMMRAGGEL
jgi:hypothetical protein